MSIRIERTAYDPESGFLYYVIFKSSLVCGIEDVEAHEDVAVAVSLTENGGLADMTFVVPKHLRTPHALAFICGEGQGSYVEPHVFAAIPGESGDTVVSVPGRLEVDMAGRIVGLVLQWAPTGAAAE
jgi:hypothetical protein